MSAPRTVTMASVRKLKPNKRNARTHSKKQIKQLVDIIRRVGWTYPILVDENGNIIAGHARYQAALYLKSAEVPVIVMSGLSESEKRALALADNKIAANAGWDRAALAAELGELAVLLPECDLTIDITAFEPAEIDAILGDFSDPERDPVDEIPQAEQRAVSTVGDLWELGSHRLLCADSLAPNNAAALMDSQLAAMVITDPPYNLKINSLVGRGRIKHREFPQASGEMSRAQFTEFLTTAMSLSTKHSAPGGLAFWFIDWRHLFEMLVAGESAYSEMMNLVIWNKTNAGQGSLYRQQHELILVFKNGDKPHTNNVQLGKFGRNRSNVWTYPGVNSFRAGRLDDLALHPTVKPVALRVAARLPHIEFFLLQLSRPALADFEKMELLDFPDQTYI